MSASAITGPSWTPWDTQHAKGAALGEMALPDPTQKPEEAREDQQAAQAPELNRQEKAGKINESLSSQLFAALLDHQDFSQTNPMGDESGQAEIANGATSVEGGSANLTDTDDASGGATGETVQQAEENDDKRGVSAQQSGSATVISAKTATATDLDDTALSAALLAQIEGARNPQAATDRLARFLAYS